jgi:hypothetical protein
MQKGAGVSDDAALKVTELITAANPEHYTAWNYRRRMLLDRARNRHATAPHMSGLTPPSPPHLQNSPLFCQISFTPFSCVCLGLMTTEETHTCTSCPGSPDALQQLVDAELVVSQAAIRKNPKVHNAPSAQYGPKPSQTKKHAPRIKRGVVSSSCALLYSLKSAHHWSECAGP